MFFWVYIAPKNPFKSTCGACVVVRMKNSLFILKMYQMQVLLWTKKLSRSHFRVHSWMLKDSVTELLCNVSLSCLWSEPACLTALLQGVWYLCGSSLSSTPPFLSSSPLSSSPGIGLRCDCVSDNEVRILRPLGPPGPAPGCESEAGLLGVVKSSLWWTIVFLRLYVGPDCGGQSEHWTGFRFTLHTSNSHH